MHVACNKMGNLVRVLQNISRKKSKNKLISVEKMWNPYMVVYNMYFHDPFEDLSYL